MSFAIIKTGGKQYKVAAHDVLKIEKLPQVKAGDQIVFDQVLLTSSGDKTVIGKSLVGGAKVIAKLVREGRAKKITIVKFKNKTRIRNKRGHRQPFTEVKIEGIE